MGWTDVFPVFTEEMVDDFEARATFQERAELEYWYDVERVINAQPDKRHIVSVSLFWKNLRKGDPDLPTPTREILQNAQNMGLAMRYCPWDHYIRPLLDLVPRLLKKFPDIVVRVYLAKDLEFLAEELTLAGNEIYLMKSSSINFAPAGLWRFLPFSESEKIVTVTDIDRIGDLESDILRSKTMTQAGLGAWRVPNPVDLTSSRRVSYRPFMGCQFGVRGGLINSQLLLKAFTWHANLGLLDSVAIFPSCGPLSIQGSEWPSYGFDEFFLTLAAYPRLAQQGMLTFVPTLSKSQLLALDIEYVTWGNPNSELIYFQVEFCCGVRREDSEHKTADDDEISQNSEKSNIEIPTISYKSQNGLPITGIVQEAKIGFLFLTIGEVNHPEIWSQYFEEAPEDGYEVFAHSKDRHLLARESLLADRQVAEELPTKWGDISLVRATLALLNAAVKKSDCTHFILVSENCVPVRPFKELERALKFDPRSRMRVQPWSEVRKWDILKAQRLENLVGIRKEIAHFHEQWMCLSREDAELILAKDRTNIFENVTAPDEAYFATVLAASGKPPLQTVVNRPVTWTDWSERKRHPESFEKVSGQIAAQISESGCFFARKFPIGSDIGRWELHLNIKTLK